MKKINQFEPYPRDPELELRMDLRDPWQQERRKVWLSAICALLQFAPKSSPEELANDADLTLAEFEKRFGRKNS